MTQFSWAINRLLANVSLLVYMDVDFPQTSLCNFAKYSPI